MDPQLSETAKNATVHLAPGIGTNMAILNGIQHLLCKDGWIDKEYVSKRGMSLEDLRQKVENYASEMVEKITGVPAENPKRAAYIIGTTKS